MRARSPFLGIPGGLGGRYYAHFFYNIYRGPGVIVNILIVNWRVIISVPFFSVKLARLLLTFWAGWGESFAGGSFERIRELSC